MGKVTDYPKLVWRATIKRATLLQKFDQKGAVHSTLQMQLEGDMLPVDQMTALAQLQQENTVSITISPTQMSFAWSQSVQEGSTDAREADAHPMEDGFDSETFLGKS